MHEAKIKQSRYLELADENKPKVDHIDNNPQNNSIANLRWVTSKENNQNRSISNRNTSGTKGIYYNKQAKKWIAYIRIDGILIHLGCFDIIEDAIQARKKKVNQEFGEFTNACERHPTRKIPMRVSTNQ